MGYDFVSHTYLLGHLAIDNQKIDWENSFNLLMNGLIKGMSLSNGFGSDGAAIKVGETKGSCQKALIQDSPLHFYLLSLKD